MIMKIDFNQCILENNLVPLLTDDCNYNMLLINNALGTNYTFDFDVFIGCVHKSTYDFCLPVLYGNYMLLCCRDYRNNSKYIEDFNELFNSVRYMYEQNIKLNLSFRYDDLGYRLYFLKFMMIVIKYTQLYNLLHDSC